MKIYDLSFDISSEMPYFKGDPKPEIEQYKTIEKDGYNIKNIRIGTHTGTHIDAPAHFIKNGKTIDQLSITDLSGLGICIEYSPEKELVLPRINFQIILLYTGYNLNWENFETFDNFPYINKEHAKILVENNVKLIGIDSPSIDMLGSKNFESHHIILGKNVPVVENLNSKVLKDLVNRSFYFLALPLKIKDGDGAPARVIAMEV